MQKEVSLYIPKPCHENWNKMTPAEHGKFCSACSKQVIDFSLMSDNQVLNFISGQTGKICGRFDAAQLERPLVETKIKKKKGWWMALTMPLLFLFERSEAQENKVVGDTVYTALSKDEPQGMLLGKVAINMSATTEPALTTYDTTVSNAEITIRGKVVDENDEPVAGANIVQKNTNHGTIADDSGKFSLNLKNNDIPLTLIISSIGFQSKEINIPDNETEEIIKLEMQYAVTGDVVVVGYSGISCRTLITGTTSKITRITSFERIDTTIRKAFGISKIFPNPASKNSLVHVEIKQSGEYQLQLFDNQSKLITIENINTCHDNSVSSFALPSNMAAGIYYLRLMNERTKKSYTEKIIIQ